MQLAEKLDWKGLIKQRDLVHKKQCTRWWYNEDEIRL
jgi:hypothetical protein